ncbi:hypothetical protein L9G74_13050 [Shewanella sp. C32]|uniref:Uncharacterized protein n=1 Tax=Shewanella electrica TaxID=515560 RepID=A0ABT2FM13_9GAMM|nr:hypothetical protein [Shewanella electrica]MCH1926020.1 hypothetical protein [Shewanella electrica]MCS4557373.1 hypothetical protein [Shewanella electrica]
MQVISNYPQVPIATSNPATDVARAENLQRPPVIPPQQPTQNHEERALNSQNERANVLAQQQARLADTVHERQQSNQQQQEQGAQDQRQQQQKAPQLQRFALTKPALDRRDIRNRVSQEPSSIHQPQSSNHDKTLQAAQQPEHFYREFAQRIGDFYQAQTQPLADAEVNASA